MVLWRKLKRDLGLACYADAGSFHRAINPENANPAFAGRDFVSAQGEINGVEPSARAPTSPNSDRPSIAPFGTPENINYRGLREVEISIVGCYLYSPAGVVPVISAHRCLA